MPYVNKRMLELAHPQHYGDGSAPWDRLPGETPRMFAMFRTYLEMREDRSVRNLAVKYGVSATYVGYLSSRHNWVSRCDAWDSYMAGKHQVILEQELRRVLARQLERRLDMDDQLWADAEDLKKQYEEMRRWPIARTTHTTADGKTITLEPAGWTKNTMVKVKELEMRIRAFATGRTSDGKNPQGQLTSGGGEEVRERVVRLRFEVEDPEARHKKTRREDDDDIIEVEAEPVTIEDSNETRDEEEDQEAIQEKISGNGHNP